MSTCQHKKPHNRAVGRADNQDVKGSHNDCINSKSTGKRSVICSYNKFSDGSICLQQVVADPQMDILSTKMEKWTELAPVPVCCTAHTAVLLDGNFYIGSGSKGISNDDFQSSYRLDVYNLTTNQWRSPITTA